MFNDRTAKFLLLAGLVLCVGGAFAPNWIVNQFMFGFSRALAILGLMVLWRTGLVSFGHAFYFGLGAYAVAILDIKLGVSDVFLRLFAGAIVAGFAGFLIGFIMRNYRDIFFAMLNYIGRLSGDSFIKSDFNCVAPPIFNVIFHLSYISDAKIGAYLICPS